MSADRTVHLLVEGLVQGVGFRAWFERQAATRRLAGWVRNRRTGAVEAVVSGDGAAVEGMIALCRNGPGHARVDALYIIGDVSDGSLGDYAGFEVRPTI